MRNRFSNKGMMPFEEFMTGLNWDYPEMPKRKLIKVDITENDKNYVLLADLPGFKKEEISVQYEDKNLTISARRETEHDEQNEKYLIQERTTDTVYRRFYIDGIDDEHADVSYIDGVLKIVLPKLSTSNEGKKFDIR
ncbi:Hsp20/alpha crystallin family protein [Proteiniclasticum sp.]|uniref:Hsp20/alpha crystallin family protein n=1 Tax=Proteiniclasticum sp. TaxID=2053595 RepID=UPI0028A038E0|nr:Hsp20/alpha crystallin family protein [Proteiniclasticum sp.]